MAASSISSSSSSSCQLDDGLKDNTHKFLSLASLPLPSNSQNNWIASESRTNLSLKASGHPCLKWRTGVSLFQSFLTKEDNVESLKQELLDAISPLDRGAEATPQDQELVDQIARKLEAVNKVKEPLKSSLLNGKWELLYTTSDSILQTKRPKILRPNGKIYQAINGDTLRAQNMETWPFFNQATANLVPLNATRVAVKFDSFKIAGVIPIMARGSGRGQLEITYLDEELRISRGNLGNLFILKMADPSYRVPL
ncbi:OLC1v1002486C1 [Oldenlandia corymbosa var. corymbosa]|uniref:OLC1v1002486C1 n=1 Tax=Oldenlandia corymbosa var. corymbosa TaxID=529605 RepID=A0AAV1D8D0_OLDCO|nr:OLC1v1002486C1 [Oldenlandia corymbosa var. corymbosa]